VFKVFDPPHRVQRIDLASVRDTLLYIESDVGHVPELGRLAVAVRSALAEIDRLERAEMPIEKPDFTAARFLPARFES
jgi:hypothetical protein